LRFLATILCYAAYFVKIILATSCYFLIIVVPLSQISRKEASFGSYFLFLACLNAQKSANIHYLIIVGGANIGKTSENKNLLGGFSRPK